MPLTKMFKLACASRFLTPPPPPPDKQDKPEPPVESAITVEKHPELVLWERAVEAAQLRKHLPDPTEAPIPIPWSHGTERTEVRTLASSYPSGRATLFLRTSLAPLDLALRLNKDFFKVLQLTVKPDIPEEEPKPDNAGKPDHPVPPPSRVWLVSRAGHHVLTVEMAPGELMYGNVLTLTSTRVAAEKALEYLESVFPLGFACIVPHDVMESSISTVMGTMRITKRTAVDSATLSAASLATVFELEDVGAPAFDNPEGQDPHGVGDQVVARCVLVYADGSSRPSVGPTIQSIAVRSDYQGSGLVLDLFNAVEGWFVKFWALDTLDLNRVFKATHLKDFVVDRATEEEGGVAGQHHVFTDKILLYEVMHFACNTPHPDDPRGHLGTHLPPESHAIKYYPRAGTMVSLPTMYYAYPNTPQGWRSCDNCKAPETLPCPGLLVCGSCTLPIYWRAHYCGRMCQREDWAVHKLWCGKTYEEVCSDKEAFEASLTVAASS